MNQSGNLYEACSLHCIYDYFIVMKIRAGGVDKYTVNCQINQSIGLMVRLRGMLNSILFNVQLTRIAFKYSTKGRTKHVLASNSTEATSLE
jgi:hypothetical protein